MKFKIQLLKLDDFDRFYPFAKDFILNQYLDDAPQVRRINWQLDFDRKGLKQSLEEKKKTVLVALSKNKIVGFALVSWGRGGGAFLAWLGTDKKFRQQGIASLLLKRIVDLARKKQFHFIYFWTENKKNVRFYKKRGYRLIGMLEEAWFGADTYLMQKSLAKPFKKQWSEKNEI